MVISKVPRWILFGCFFLALCAGYLNAISLFELVHVPTSHLTGTVSTFASSLFSREYATILQTGLIILSFFLGAIVTGSIVHGRSLYLGKRYGSVLILESAFLMIAFYFFKNSSIVAIYLIAFVCGLQNALVTTYSNSIIRTTHLTGIVTDIGAALGCFLSTRAINKIQIKLHLAIFFSFLFGTLLGSFAYRYLHFYSVLVPAATIFIMGIGYFAYLRKCC